MTNSLEPGTDIDVSRTTHWLTGSAVVVFVCGVLAIVLPLTFSIGVAGLLGWLFIFAAVAHLVAISFLSSGISRLLLGLAIRVMERTQPPVA